MNVMAFTAYIETVQKVNYNIQFNQRILVHKISIFIKTQIINL